MKSRTYSHLGKLIEECQPHLGKLGETLVTYAVGSGKQFLAEKEQKENIKEEIGEEYFQLTGKYPNPQLAHYISDSVNQGWQLYQKYGEKKANTFAISQLEKVKVDFTLESRVNDTIDQKIKSIQNK